MSQYSRGSQYLPAGCISTTAIKRRRRKWMKRFTRFGATVQCTHAGLNTARKYMAKFAGEKDKPEKRSLRRLRTHKKEVLGLPQSETNDVRINKAYTERATYVRAFG